MLLRPVYGHIPPESDTPSADFSKFLPDMRRASPSWGTFQDEATSAMAVWFIILGAQQNCEVSVLPR